MFTTFGGDEALMSIKESISEANYISILRAFKKLWGYPDRIVPDTDVDGIPFLVEKNFTQNISEVTG